MAEPSRQVCSACDHVKAHHGKQDLAQLPYDPRCQWRGCGCPRFIAPPPVQHHRVGPGKCACGHDAYKVGWGMVDYGDLLYGHIDAAKKRARSAS